MTESTESTAQGNGQQLSLSTDAARNLATTTKTAPQMQEITSRWLLKLLPWVQTSGGVYRVNRRLTYTLGDGRITFSTTGAEVRVVPAELCELPMLRGFGDIEALEALAYRFAQREVEAGEEIVREDDPIEQLVLIAHGRVAKVTTGAYGDQQSLGMLADGDHLGEQLLLGGGQWEFSARAKTATTVLTLSREDFQALLDRSPSLREHLEAWQASGERAHNDYGEAAIDMSSGHSGEPILPGTFVDYELSPREYELSVVQTVLRVHSRVTDLYNQPMNQLDQQLRLTIEALRERQEDEMINNRDFGLLHNADFSQRLRARSDRPPLTTWTTCWPRYGRTRPSSSRTRRRSRPSAGSAASAACIPRPPRRAATGCGLARRADLPVQQDPRFRTADELRAAHAHRPGKSGRRRPAPDRPPR